MKSEFLNTFSFNMDLCDERVVNPTTARRKSLNDVGNTFTSSFLDRNNDQHPVVQSARFKRRASLFSTEQSTVSSVHNTKDLENEKDPIDTSNEECNQEYFAVPYDDSNLKSFISERDNNQAESLTKVDDILERELEKETIETEIKKSCQNHTTLSDGSKVNGQSEISASNDNQLKKANVDDSLKRFCPDLATIQEQTTLSEDHLNDESDTFDTDSVELKRIKSKKISKWKQIKRNLHGLMSKPEKEAIKVREKSTTNDEADGPVVLRPPKARGRSASIFAIRTPQEKLLSTGSTLKQDGEQKKRTRRSHSLADISMVQNSPPSWMTELGKKANRSSSLSDTGNFDESPGDSNETEDNESVCSELDCDFQSILEDPQLFQHYLKVDGVNLVRLQEQNDCLCAENER